jgi:hypothetical protein
MASLLRQSSFGCEGWKWASSDGYPALRRESRAGYDADLSHPALAIHPFCCLGTVGTSYGQAKHTEDQACQHGWHRLLLRHQEKSTQHDRENVIQKI